MDNQKLFLGFTPYQWLVLFAAWLGWGFDVFDALLFNYVSRLCIPSLLQIPPTDPDIQNHITFWTGIITSLLLVGWGVGGIVFGMLTDRLGRSRTLLITMVTYALATAACAFSPNIWMLLVFRFIASLGIGGEWAAGASLVAETVPEKKRVTAGALLYTAAPMGLFLATFVTDLFTRQLDAIASDPDLSWRAVFLTGLIPAVVALLIRLKVKEPETWERRAEVPRLGELFTPEMRRRTIGGITLSAVALIAWWSISAFIPAIASFLATDLHLASGQQGVLAHTKARCLTLGTTAFNLGGLIGTLLTIPAAVLLGRRQMFLLYYLCSAALIWITFSCDFEVHTRLYMFGLLGLSLFGIGGAFTFYLPELFPSYLRGTGSGFCYNVARFVTALGPFAVASIAGGTGSTQEILDVVRWVALVPALGFLVIMAGIGEEPRADHG
jgi:MFS family permease